MAQTRKKKSPSSNKAAAKKAPAKRAAPKKSAKKVATRTRVPARKAAAPRKRTTAKAEEPPATRDAEDGKEARTRVIFPREVYAERKDDIKAPLKKLGLKWQYLGPGKGRYHAAGVQVFVQHTDEGADFTYWGTDEAATHAIADAWDGIPTKSTAAVEEAEKEEELSEAMRFWMLQKPQRRPGEPEGFFRRRVAEWKSAKPDA